MWLPMEGVGVACSQLPLPRVSSTCAVCASSLLMACLMEARTLESMSLESERCLLLQNQTCHLLHMSSVATEDISSVAIE